MTKTLKFIQGNEACVEAALYAGLEFFAGYPITPSSEIAELLSHRLPRGGGKFLQMEDEIASICAIIGASLTGRKVMTATSGPGFSLMQEAAGVCDHGGNPLCDRQCTTRGTLHRHPDPYQPGDVNQARWGTHGDHSIIALTGFQQPGCLRDDGGGFQPGRDLPDPVVLLLDEMVGHLREAPHYAGTQRHTPVERLPHLRSGRGGLSPLSAQGGRPPAHVRFRGRAPLQMSPVFSMTCGVFPRTIRPWCGSCFVTWWIKSTTTSIKSSGTTSIIWRMPSVS